VYTLIVVHGVFLKTETISSLCRELGVDRLFLFGSATSAMELAEVQDLDFLVRFKPMDPIQYSRSYFSLAERLEDLFKKPVDLVELDSIKNPFFMKAVEETKVPLYESS
jgi:uncharacterized protein